MMGGFGIVILVGGEKVVDARDVYIKRYFSKFPPQCCLGALAKGLRHQLPFGSLSLTSLLVLDDELHKVFTHSAAIIDLWSRPYTEAVSSSKLPFSNLDILMHRVVPPFTSPHTYLS